MLFFGHPQKHRSPTVWLIPCPHPCRGVLTVWKGIIEGTTYAGQARVNASESYRSLATEAAKTARLSKERMLKKVRAEGTSLLGQGKDSGDVSQG